MYTVKDIDRHAILDYIIVGKILERGVRLVEYLDCTHAIYSEGGIGAEK